MTKTNQVISSVILAACFPILAISPSHPASLLFIFISGDKWVGTARLALALIMLALSFRLIKPARTARKPLLAAGTGLIAFGLIALLATSLGSFLYDYMKILDVMIALEAGIVLCSTALSLQAANRTITAANAKAKRPKAKTAPA